MLGERLKWQRRGHPRAFIECVLQVGDFGDAINWPTPGEIAHKCVQVSLRKGMGRMKLLFIFTHLAFQAFRASGLKRNGWCNLGSTELSKRHHVSPGCVLATANCCLYSSFQLALTVTPK